MRLNEAGEFGLIDRIKTLLKPSSKQVILGIDDDAAVIKSADNSLLVLTTDAFVEGVHFDLSYLNFGDLGWRTLAANLSDVAAMGGWPRYGLVSLALRDDIEVESVEALYSGMKELAEKFDVDIIGGDTTSSPDRIFISVSVLGEVGEQNVITRDGAKAGDTIFVTGDLGAAQAGLKVLQTGDTALYQRFSHPVEKHRRPQPRVEEAKFLVSHFPIHAMIDVSDGLASEINHICRQSQVGAEVYSGKISVHSQTVQAVTYFEEDVLEYALNRGEDFELLFTTPAGSAAEISERFFKEFGYSCTAIGKIVEQSNAVNLVDEKGAATPLTSAGFDHFRMGS